MESIDWERLERFLAPPQIALLVTVGPEGAPHPTPVWYRYTARFLTVSTTIPTIKVRNLRRDSRLAVCVYNDVKGTEYVSMIGVAQVIEGSDIWDETKKIVEHYVEPGQVVDEWISRMRLQQRVIIRMAIRKVWWRG